MVVSFQVPAMALAREKDAQSKQPGGVRKALTAMN